VTLPDYDIGIYSNKGNFPQIIGKLLIQVIMERFHYASYAQEVIFGPGSILQVGEAVERFGWRRLVLCTNRSVRRGGHIGSIESVLKERITAVFDQVQPHVQDFQVDEVLELLEEKSADAVIGMGGGSPIGMAKAVASTMEEKGLTASPAGRPHVQVVALPTTYAGSEMTPIYGITHTRETPPRKVTVNDPKCTPRLVIYDPELTLDLPPEMTASTGINALAHCIEALYSITRNPLSTAAATSGVRHISKALARCYEHGEDIESRAEMQLGAHLAGLSLASVAMGLHHGLCHVLGGTAQVPHGIANSIILPHAVRFNTEATAAQLLPAAEAMGISGDDYSPVEAVEIAAQRIYELVGQMNLPQRLRDAGVKESDLPRIAQIAFQNHTIQNNPRQITGASEIEGLLREAW
jgi:maleylacetate reductase